MAFYIAYTLSIIQKSAKLHHMTLIILIYSLISKSLRSCTIWLFTLLIHCLLSKSLRSCTVQLSQCYNNVYYPKVCEATPYGSHHANTQSNIQKSVKLHHMAFYIAYTLSINQKSAKLHHMTLIMLIHSVISKSLRSYTI